MREPLIPPFAALLAGILLSRMTDLPVWQALWPIAVFAGLAMLAARVGNRWLKRISAGLALVFAGLLTGAWHRPGPPPEIDAGSRETVILAGCVVEPSVLSPRREQFTLDLDPGARARVTLPIEDADPAGSSETRPQTLRYGQRVEIEARIRAPRNFRNPGSFDYAGYLARQQIYWTATMRRGTIARILPGRCGSRGWAMLYALREAALDRLEKLYAGDEYLTGMMEATLIGETARLEKIWTENFRRTGTFHALVISGAHVAVLAGVLLVLLRLCMMPELPALTLTAIAAWLYALISGFSPPVARAAGGFTLYLVVRFFYRRGRVLNLLAAVAIVYLLWRPDELLDASFQLSFLSVAAIGAFAAPLIEATSQPLATALSGLSNVAIDPHLPPRVAQIRVELRLIVEALHYVLHLPVRWVLEALGLALRGMVFAYDLALVSAVMQIGLALPMAEYFHRVSFTGLSANLVIVPLLEAAVPIGFFAILSGWRWPAAIAGWLMKEAGRVADWHAAIEPSWRVADPPVWLAIGLIAALIGFAIAIQSADTGRIQARIWRWSAGAAVLLLFGLLLWQPWPAAISPRQLELTAIDVGQGDSLLVVFPEGRSMVIDGGGVLQFGKIQRRPNLDTGEDVVSPYLWSRGIRRIDVLVVTHAHEDHSGGAAALMANFRPRELWVGTNPPEAILAQAAQLGIAIRAPVAGAKIPFSGARIEVLSPPEGFAPRKPGNNDSLAFRIVYGQRSFLLTGDLERPMEQRLLSDGRAVQADVLKVGHHGSKTSTSEPFLEVVSPSIAVISAGFENSFGHPNREVLERLVERHSAILRTDLDGLATVRTDGQRLIFDTVRWHEAGYPYSLNWAGFDWTMAVEGR